MRVNGEQLKYSEGPYDWEYIPERPPESRYRIFDRKDNAVGSASCMSDANKIVSDLNSKR